MAGTPPVRTRFDWPGDHDPYIIALVNAAIANGQISAGAPAIGAANRVAPSIRVTYTTACQTPAMTAILQNKVAGTAPVFVSGGTANGGAGTPTLATPAGAVGDLILAAIYRHSEENNSFTTGFQRLTSNYDGNSNTRAELWFKLADGTEPANLTANVGLDFWVLDAVRYSGTGGINGLAFLSQRLQQPNSGSPQLTSDPAVGPFLTNSLMAFFGNVFGGTVLAAGTPTNSGGAALTLRVGVVGGPNFVADIRF